jgi:hypothetical protein
VYYAHFFTYRQQTTLTSAVRDKRLRAVTEIRLAAL